MAVKGRHRVQRFRRAGKNALPPALPAAPDTASRALPRRRIPEALLAAAVSGLGAALFVTAGPYGNFAPAGFIDPWLYTGYFSNLPYMLRHYGLTYYVSRLPWILPGRLAFLLASPQKASLFLNALLVAVCALSLYWIVRWYFGRVPAALASIALVTNLYFYSTTAWDYPDGPSIAYAFAAVAFAVRPNGRHTLNMVAAGVLFALSGFTNMAAGPMILGGLLMGNRRYRRSLRDLFREALRIGLGVAMATFVFCLISKLVLGQYQFFRPQIQQTIQLSGTGYLASWGRGFAFLMTAFRLFPVAFMLVIGGALVLVRSKRRAHLLQTYLFLLVAAALYTSQEFLLHGAALRVSYVSSYILVPVFCLAGAVIGEFWNRAAAPRFHPAVVILFVLFSLGLPYLGRIWYAAYAHPGRVWLAMALTGVAACRLGFLPGRPALSACALVILLLFWGPGLDRGIAYPLWKENARDFDSTIAIHNAVQKAVPADRPVRFWYDSDEPGPPIFNAVSSMYLWGSHEFSPATTRDVWNATIANDTVLALLTVEPAKIPGRLRLLEAHGIHVGNERRRQFPAGQYTYYLVLEDVTDRSGLH
jgi:hypothetical protein